jgi:hypothetical protein
VAGKEPAVTTADSMMTNCSAQGCVYLSDPGTMDLFCAAHWTLVSPELQKLLRNEHKKSGTSGRWLNLAKLAVEYVAREEAHRALLEERGYYRPKAEARGVA